MVIFLLKCLITQEPYLKAHVEKFAHKSICTSDFKSYIFEFFKTQPDGDSKLKILSSVDWDGWFNTPGMPLVENKFDDSLARVCIRLADQWDAARENHQFPTDEKAFESMNSNQKIMFLEKLLLKEKLPLAILVAMESLYCLTEIKNAEIRFRWQWLCLNAEWESIFPDVVAFITSVGRMKFVRPLYR